MLANHTEYNNNCHYNTDIPQESFLLRQILTSVPREHTPVMLMLYVTTPRHPITARAKVDFMEME